METRIREQTHTATIKTEILWDHLAEYVDGPDKGLNFKDHDFHGFLKFHDIERRPKTEWFYFNGTPEKSEGLFNKFIRHDVSGYQPGKVMNMRYVGSKTKLLRKQRLISLVMKIANFYGMQNLGLVKHYQLMI